jgi:O-antigen/teichoic acid export membrane protein
MVGYGTLVKGLLWLLSGRMASAVLSLLSTAVLARLLTPSDFGVFAAALVVLALANVLFDGAFGVNLVRKAELRDEDIRTTLTTALGIAALVTISVCLMAPAAERFFGFLGLALVQSAASAAIPFKAVFAVASAQLQRERRFSAIAAASLLGQFCGYILLAIPLSLTGAGVWALAAALVTSAAVEAAVGTILVRLSFRPCWDRQALRDIAGTSLFSLSHLFNWAANAGANTVVGRLMGAADLGLYSRGWKLLDLIVAATATPLSKVLLPAFAQLNGQPEQLREAFLRILGIVLPAYALLSVLFALQSPAIVELVLGNQWSGAIPVVQILFAALLPRCAFKVSENFAMAIGRSSAAAARQGIYAALMAGGALLGTRYGVSGVAIGVSAAVSIFYLLSMSYAVRIGRIRISSVVSLHARAALLALCAGLADLAALSLFGAASILERHAFAGVLGMSVAALLLFAWPSFWLGRANGQSVKYYISSFAFRGPFGRFFPNRY